MRTIPLDDVFKLAEIAPDLSLGQAASVLKWIAARHGTVEQGPAPDALAIGGGSIMAEPAPAAPPPSRAAKGGAAHKITQPRKPAASAKQPPSASPWANTWSQAEVEKALFLRSKGLTHDQIGARLHRTSNAISIALSAKRLTRYGLTLTSQKDGTDAAPGPTGQTIDAGQHPDIGDLDECASGLEGSAPASPVDEERPEAVPALDPGRPAAGREQQPDRHDPVGIVDVADVPSNAQPAIGRAPSPIPTPTLPPAPVVDPRLTARQRRLVDHLGWQEWDGFTPDDDLFLVEELARGTPGNVVADQLDRSLKSVGLRFRAMQTDDIVNSKGVLTIDGQADLLVAVRYRVGRHE